MMDIVLTALSSAWVVVHFLLVALVYSLSAVLGVIQKCL
jgi:hypothetical protein